MTLLFSSKSNIREIIVAVAKKSFEHGFNLGKFVLIYKAVIGLSVKGSGSNSLLGRPSHPLHAMAAGAIGACVALSCLQQYAMFCARFFACFKTISHGVGYVTCLREP